MDLPLLETERLHLRSWRADDLEAFARLNADAQVMRHFPQRLQRADSDALAARIAAHVAEHGFGQWVVERRADGAFLGVLGLQWVSFAAAFTPAVEIGWRLSAAHWRQGYALEAARAALGFAFSQLALDEVLAFTVPGNQPSRWLMQRLGMRHDPSGDFEHPRLPLGHVLRPHVLYRLRRTDWEATRDDR